MSEEYLEFITNIKRKLGIDLTLYKEAQMKRRLTSLRNKHGYPSFNHYFSAITNDDILLKEFLDRITINVSEFYRNPKRWDALKTAILPDLFNDRKKLSIWSAACSTGEEPYSIAILIKQYFPNIDFQVLATDIDENALDKAKMGVYTEQALKELPELLKHNYFSYEQGFYHISKEIKKHVRFRKHDLLADRYPVATDLIICRNVLIYFTDWAKDKIYQHFSESLRQNGVLFVGSTEQIFNPNKYNLSLIDTFFYQKNIV